MPRLAPQTRKRITTVYATLLLALTLAAFADASAQGRRRPAGRTTPQQQGNANANTAASQQPKSPKKNITPLRSSDTAEGSRITITSDVPLNDYSAFRSGDRYYVVIPQASAGAAKSGMRGRGFEDVQVQKRGDDTVLSFKLQPGTNARVNQKFNRLDVELTTPGGGTPSTANVSPTPRATPEPPVNTRPTPETAITTPTPRTSGAGITEPIFTPPPYAGNPSTTYPGPTPEIAPSPAVSPDASPAITPPTDQIAQAQPPPANETATTTTTAAPAATGSTLGTVLRQNWLLLLLGALVLGSILMIVVARARAQRGAAVPARRVRKREKSGGPEKSKEELPEADESSTVSAAAPIAVATATAEPEVETLVTPVVAAGAVETLEEAPAAEEVTAEQVVAEEAVTEVAPVVDEVTPVVGIGAPAVDEVAPAVDVERAGIEVDNVLTGETYDEAIVGASDAGTRQLVAAGLLAALAARNVERRDRAREAFIKYEYLDEATRNLRTAEAAAERSAAARALGYVGDRSATPHLVAALEDKAPEVRRASVEALAGLHDPAAVAPLKELLERERDRKVPKNLIKHAIEASSTIEVEEAPTLEAEPPAAEEVTAEQPAVIAEADLSGPEVVAPEVAAGLLSAVAPAVEEAETGEDEAAARVRAEEEAEAERAREEERKRAEEERLRAEEEAARREEEEARLKAEAEAEAQRVAEEEEVRRKAEEERLLAEAEAKRLAEEEAQRKAEEEARLRAEQEEAARLKAEEEARLRAEEEKRLAEEEAARLKAEEEEARRKAEEDAARLKAEEEARQKAEEEARLKAEEEARLKAEEEARLQAEEAARLRAEEEARARAEEEARLRAEEEERLRLEEEERQRAEAEAARLREEEEARRKAEEERLRAEEEARLAAEAEALRKAEEEEARQKAEEEARLKAEEEARLKAEEEAARVRAEEEAAANIMAEAVSPVETPAVPLIERNDGAEAGWVEVDIAEPETVEAAVEPEPVAAELVEAGPVVQESKAIEPSGVSTAGLGGQEKGIATLDEFSTVPGGILKRLSSEEPAERAAAVSDLARVGGDDSFREINSAFDDPAVEVRNAAARTLFGMSADRAATFTRALREAPPERRRKIGAALASSGLASEAIGQLMGESREKTYDAFSLLFLMSKAGEVQPLMRAIEEHPNNEVRLAVVKLLALSGQQEILPAFRRLAVRGSLPTEVRSAVMEAIYQISSQSPTPA